MINLAILPKRVVLQIAAAPVLWTTAIAIAVLTASGLHAADVVAVRAKRPITIDGDVTDWPAGRRWAISQATGMVGSFAMAFDGDRLYLQMQVQDDSPLKNSTSRFDAPMLLKGGDAIGLCFGPARRATGQQPGQQRYLAALLQGEAMVALYRPQSATKKPYTFTSPVSTYVIDYAAPAPEASVAFKPTTGGYQAEMQIPWTMVGVQPKDGLELAFDAQVIFGDPSGTRNVATTWWHSRANGPACTTDLPTEARLYADEWGTLRLQAEDAGTGIVPARDTRASGPAAEEPGFPITFTLPRACRASLVVTDSTGWIVAEPLRAEPLAAGPHTVTWNGRGYRAQPLPPGRYQWRLGYFDGVDSKVYGSVGNSGSPPFATSDNKGSIGGIHNGPAAVASDADGVFLAHSGEEGEHGLRKITTSGEVLWTHSLGGFGDCYGLACEGGDLYQINASGNKVSLVRLEAKSGRDVKIGPTTPRVELAATAKTTFNGLTILAGKAYCASTGEDRLLVVDLATGELGQPIAIAKPRCPERFDERQIAVCSADSVILIDPAAGTRRVLLKGLDEPSAVAIDAQGVLWVAEGGSRQQIRSWSREGKLLGTFGKAGGREATAVPYDPLALRNVTDLAFDAAGDLWFVESGWTPPRRIGRMTKTGTWVSDYCGPVYCSSGMVVDLDDPSNLYYHLRSSYMQSKVGFAPDHDWRKMRWSIQAIFDLGVSAGEALPEALRKPVLDSSFTAGIAFTGRNGVRYLWLDGDRTYTRGGDAILYRWKDRRWVLAGIQANPERNCWADLDGDGRIQESEQGGKAPSGGWRWMDRDLVLYGHDGSLAPARIDERGVPVYDGGRYTPYLDPPPSKEIADFLQRAPASPPAADGAVFHVTNVGAPQGRAFWDRCSENKLVKVHQGKVQWMVGHHDATNAHEGDLTSLYNVCGVVDGVVIITYVANQYIAYTDDGLLLGWLLKDEKGRPKWSDESYVSAESFSGQFIKDPKTGKYLLFCGASESCQVREVVGIGPKAVSRLTGTIDLVSSPPRTQPIPGVYAIPYASWEGANGVAQGINAEDWEWWPRRYETMTIRDGQAVIADIRLRRDAGQLHLFAEVVDGTPVPQGSTPRPGDLFCRADGLEILIGPAQPAARTAPGPGDTRIFLSGMRDAKGVLVPVLLAHQPGGKPVPPHPEMRRMATKGVYQGNPPTEPIDLSAGPTLIPGAVMAIRERLDGRGYRIEAEIPLAAFPEMAAQRSQTFRRWSDDNNQVMRPLTEDRYDLSGPVRLQATVLLGSDAGVRRASWVPENGSASAPGDAAGAAMDPSRWGTGLAPSPVPAP
jgi:hypothetical protein